jgi:hypothetical protein
MNSKHLNTDFTNLKELVQSLLHDREDILPNVVSKEDQQQEIEFLKRTIGGERFFFTIDMAEFEIAQAYGINKWLGYSENQISLYDYWEEIVHPQCRKPLLLIAHQLYSSLCRGEYPLQFMVQRYSSSIALRHRDGHYLLAKKTSSVFQHDSKNRLLGYLNEFTIIGNYNGEPIEPRMYNSFGERETVKEKEILEKTMQRFLNMRIFSAKELQTARILAYNPEATQNSIAEEFGVTRHTVNTFYRRFLDKSREFFQKEFRSATEAAIFLRKEGLL